MKTEWGVEDRFGSHPVDGGLESAERIVQNMKTAGLEAKVIWRGVTEWREHDSYDD